MSRTNPRRRLTTIAAVGAARPRERVSLEEAPRRLRTQALAPVAFAPARRAVSQQVVSRPDVPRLEASQCSREPVHSPPLVSRPPSPPAATMQAKLTLLSIALAAEPRGRRSKSPGPRRLPSTEPATRLGTTATTAGGLREQAQP